jgi:hypothetical protein
MADPEFFILKQWAWLDAAEYSPIILGGFLKNYADPTDAYIPKKGAPSHLKYSESKPVPDDWSNFVASSLSSASTEAAATLKSLAGVSFKGSKEEAVNLSGKFLRSQRIEQVDDFFTKVREDAAVKSRVPEWIAGRDKDEVCLVTGIMICEDVEIGWESESGTEKEGHVEAPVGMITLAAGFPNPLGDTGDSGASLTKTEMKGRLFKAKSGKSKIFALQLRNVTKGYWIKRERDKLILAKKGPQSSEGRLLDGDEGAAEDPSIPDDALFLI